MNPSVSEQLRPALERVDRGALEQVYREQDEFVVVENLLPAGILGLWEKALEALKPRMHRNFIPKHKKGGSVPYRTVRELGPAITAVYHDPGFLQLLQAVAGAPMRECPESDPHRCALYGYTEEGDHIGWHYDTSYYRDRRWTVLVGLADRSSSRLECRLHTRSPGRALVEMALQVLPGSVVIFNGDRVYHRVTPIRRGEERYMVSMQYVTQAEMNPFLRFISNMKDAVAYFGLREVFTGRMRRR